MILGKECRTDMFSTGYTVEKNEFGEYVYINEEDNGETFTTSELVGRFNPVGEALKKGVKPKKDCYKKICGGVPDNWKEEEDIDADTYAGDFKRHGRRTAKTTGVLKNLVVLLYFKDHAQQGRKVPSEAEIDVLMNADEADPYLCPTGSLKSAYLEMSYGQLEIRSTVTPWITLSREEKWYADGSSG